MSDKKSPPGITSSRPRLSGSGLSPSRIPGRTGDSGDPVIIAVARWRPASTRSSSK